MREPGEVQHGLKAGGPGCRCAHPGYVVSARWKWPGGSCNDPAASYMTDGWTARGAARGLEETTRMLTVVIVIHLMIVLALIGVVLLQKSEGGGLGMGGGGAGGFLTSRGTANVLTRATAILALCFFVTSLLLSILAGLERKPRSIVTPGRVRRRRRHRRAAAARACGRPARHAARRRTGAGGARRAGRSGGAAGSEVAAKGRVSGPSVFAGQVGRLAGEARWRQAPGRRQAVWNRCGFKGFETPARAAGSHGGCARGRHEGSG